MEPAERDVPRPFRVVIVGGGASGALVAINLLRERPGGARDRRRRAARGARPGHRVLDAGPVAPAQRAGDRDERALRRTGALPALVRRATRGLRPPRGLRPLRPGGARRGDRRVTGLAAARPRRRRADRAGRRRRPRHARRRRGDHRRCRRPRDGPRDAVRAGLPARAGRRRAAHRRSVGGRRPRRHPRRRDRRHHRHEPDGDRPRGLDPQPPSAGDGRRAVAPREPAAVARGPVAAATARARLHRRRVPGVRSPVGGRIGAPPRLRRRLATRHRLVAADRPGAVDGDERRPAARVPGRLPQRLGDPPPPDRRRDRARRRRMDRGRADGRPRGGDPGGRARGRPAPDHGGRGRAGRAVRVGGGPDHRRDRAQRRRDREPAAAPGDRGRLAAPGSDGDRDRRRPDDRPGDRRARPVRAARVRAGSAAQGRAVGDDRRARDPRAGRRDGPPDPRGRAASRPGRATARRSGSRRTDRVGAAVARTRDLALDDAVDRADRRERDGTPRAATAVGSAGTARAIERRGLPERRRQSPGPPIRTRRGGDDPGSTRRGARLRHPRTCELPVPAVFRSGSIPGVGPHPGGRRGEPLPLPLESPRWSPPCRAIRPRSSSSTRAW